MKIISLAYWKGFPPIERVETEGDVSINFYASPTIYYQKREYPPEGDYTARFMAAEYNHREDVLTIKYRLIKKEPANV